MTDFWKFFSDFLKILWPYTWHLRHCHWLHCWQLRTTILTITLLPLNKEWQGQHSQFLGCFWCTLICLESGPSTCFGNGHRALRRLWEDGRWIIDCLKTFLIECHHLLSLFLAPSAIGRSGLFSSVRASSSWTPSLTVLNWLTEVIDLCDVTDVTDCFDWRVVVNVNWPLDVDSA